MIFFILLRGRGAPPQNFIKWPNIVGGQLVPLRLGNRPNRCEKSWRRSTEDESLCALGGLEFSISAPVGGYSPTKTVNIWSIFIIFFLAHCSTQTQSDYIIWQRTKLSVTRWKKIGNSSLPRFLTDLLQKFWTWHFSSLRLIMGPFTRAQAKPSVLAFWNLDIE
jgi:hypothetical protein